VTFMCILDYVPFTYCRKEEKGSSEGYMVDYKAIVQALIIAIVTGSVSVYATQQTLQVQLDNIQSSINTIQQRQHDFRRDFYKPVGR